MCCFFLNIISACTYRTIQVLFLLFTTHQTSRINVCFKICCVLQTRWRYCHLPVAMKAFLNSFSDSVPVFEMSVRKKMSCSKRRQFPLVLWSKFVSRKYGWNYKSESTFVFTLYVATFFQRRTNSSPFSLPVTDVCQLVRAEIPCTFCSVILTLSQLWFCVLHFCYVITCTLLKCDIFFFLQRGYIHQSYHALTSIDTKTSRLQVS